MSSIFGAIKNAIADAKGSELEKKVRKITSSDNWPVANSTKAEVAVAARSPQGCREVMAIVWEKLDLPNKEWRQIVKTLELLEVMVRLSSERVVDETREYQRGISRLTDFHYSEDGRDRGAGIREKSQYIMKLLNDQQLLKEVRAQAKENQQKCVAISSDGSARNTGAYDAYSYNDDHYESAFANGGYDTPAPKAKAQAQGAAQAGGAHKSPAVVKKPAPKKAAPPPKQVSDGEEESDGEDEDEAEQARAAKAKAAAKKAAAKPKAKKIAVEMDGDEPVAAPAAAKRSAAPVQHAVPAVQPQVPASSQPAPFNWDDMGASLPVQPAAAAPVRAAPAPSNDGFDMFDPRAPAAAPVAAPPVAVARQPAVDWDPFTGAAAAPAAPAPKQPMQIPVDLFDRPAVPAAAPAASGDIDFGDFKSAEAPKKAAAPADALWGSSLVGGGTFSLTNAPAAAPKPTGPAKPSMSAMRATGPTGPTTAAGSAGAGAGGAVGDFFFSGPAAAVAPLYPTAPAQPQPRQPQYPNAGAGYPMGMGMGMNMGMGMGMGMGVQQPMGMNPYAAQAQMPMMPALLPVRQAQPQPAAANSAAFFFN